MNNIQLKFPDNSTKEFPEGITGLEIARAISEGLAKNALAVKVNNSVFDLTKPITENAEIKILTFDDEEGKNVYWHSTSHLMAHAILSLYPEAKFGVGPAIENGFYYDFDINSKLNEDDLLKIEKKMTEIAEANHPFVRKELSRKEAIRFFIEKNDNYKIEILNELPEDAKISIYEEGDFVDLCTGPHLPNTGLIKNIKLLTVSGSYWRGDEKNKALQRIYGISFPKKKMLDDYLAFLEEAKKRDHRKLGKQLDLFTIHDETGAGLVHWHPNGARIRHIIEDFWKKEHFKNGYDLIYSPHIGKGNLWETSGHLGFYKENMYSPMKIDDIDYYIKPMNCPFHIMMYKSRLHSYKDLPIRWAELGTVYRYEKSGVLHGLLRVRGFTQDDAHIFCAKEQIESEIIEVIRFCMHIWRSLGFDKMEFYLATKPEDAVGEDELWEKAIESLKNALAKENIKYKIDEGGGAFYGPKIDIKIKDALNREWQMSTVQFDFNLPERFDLKYIGEDGKEHRPFMVHRALLGSIERFMGVLIEHYGGDFPVWFAPTQVAIIPVSENLIEYCEGIKKELLNNEIRVKLDYRNEKIGYKIRDWEMQKIPYMLIIGEKEKSNKKISVRKHKVGDLGNKDLNEFLSELKHEINNKVINN